MKLKIRTILFLFSIIIFIGMRLSEKYPKSA
jgi:hypothetical protein